MPLALSKAAGAEFDERHKEKSSWNVSLCSIFPKMPWKQEGFFGDCLTVKDFLLQGALLGVSDVAECWELVLGGRRNVYSIGTCFTWHEHCCWNSSLVQYYCSYVADVFQGNHRPKNSLHKQQ